MKSTGSFTDKRGGFPRNRWLPLLLLCLFPHLVSCGGEGGGIGGTGATDSPASPATAGVGITSVGAITARGSIVVNGVAFGTAGAAVTLAGADGDETGLQVGMVVKVEGTVNPDGKTGVAHVVAFDPTVEGPVNGIDLAGGALEVMGQSVRVDGQTLFAGLPAATPGLAGLAVADWVEISGLADAGGIVKATRIARKTADRPAQLSGRVSGLTNAAFTINGLAVDFGGAIPANIGPAGIQTGDIVTVKGTLTAPTALRADLIERKSPDFADGAIAIEGVIDSPIFGSASISGLALVTPFGLLRVDMNAATVFSGGLPGAIQAGVRVAVEGTIQNSVIQASKRVFF